jgi:DNA-directed RNA polymerase specialized sigma24 family protein
LPETYKTAFSLGVMMKLPYQEICDITGWSMASVKSNIFRARKSVADLLIEFKI